MDIDMRNPSPARMDIAIQGANHAQKKMLRARCREIAERFTEEYIEEAGRAMAERVRSLKAYGEAETVFCYMSMPKEASTEALLEALFVKAGVDAPVKPHHVQDGRLRKVEYLVRDAEDARLDGRVLVHRRAVGEYFAGILPQHAGEVLHRRRLARAVRAHQAVHRAGGGRQRKSVQRPVAAVALDHVPEFNLHAARPPFPLCAGPARPASRRGRAAPRLSRPWP